MNVLLNRVVSKRLLAFLKGFWCNIHQKGTVSCLLEGTSVAADVSGTSMFWGASMFVSSSSSLTLIEDVEGTVGRCGDAVEVVVVGLVMV